MRNEKNVDHIGRGNKDVITGFSLTYKMSTACRFIIYQGKQKKHKNKFQNHFLQHEMRQL